jgi:hypothetical protein
MQASTSISRQNCTKADDYRSIRIASLGSTHVNPRTLVAKRRKTRAIESETLNVIRAFQPPNTAKCACGCGRTADGSTGPLCIHRHCEVEISRRECCRTAIVSRARRDVVPATCPHPSIRITRTCFPAQLHAHVSGLARVVFRHRIVQHVSIS